MASRGAATPAFQLALQSNFDILPHFVLVLLFKQTDYQLMNDMINWR